ncbi:antirestriction protein ArdA, partial [Hyphomonas sp. GM-8P]|uniref:antirestriction protein ArdA n=1 Tax=Hyphomonas sp. GM-8P TaxID=1280945 RepID=UPI000DC0021F
MPCNTATPAPLGTASALPSEDAPRIYVACLAAYNNGCLHGRWIEATTPDDIMGQVRAMLAASPLPGAEEWAIHGATRK